MFDETGYLEQLPVGLFVCCFEECTSYLRTSEGSDPIFYRKLLK